MTIEDIVRFLGLPAEIREHYDMFFKVGDSLHPHLRIEELHAYALRAVQTMYAPRLIESRHSIASTLRQKAKVTAV